MQTLWTSASGLAAQQARLDTIADNIANVNTTGYKSEDASFVDLLNNEYVQNGPDGAVNTRQGMSGVRIGDGVRLVPEPISFTQGPLSQTQNPLDFAISGDGMFAISVPGVGTAYTRDGSFQVSQAPNGSTMLATKQGYPVLDVNGLPINFTGVDSSTLSVASDGTMTAHTSNGAVQQVGQLQLAAIQNRGEALRPIGDSAYVLAPGYKAQSQLFLVTPAQLAQVGAVRQGFVEQSNVDLTVQMTDMMTAQRALELSAKAVSTADTMMGLANNLRS